jgi:UDP-N-acetylglucosamine 4-epimerase
MGNGKKQIWLVSGCAGFIGSHLAQRLLESGYAVVGIDNFLTGSMRNIEAVRAGVDSGAGERFFFEECDIRDRNRCAQIFSKYSVEVVLHQAALGSVPRSIDDPITSHDVNVTGFMHMLDAARCAGVKRFVYASSSSVYGDIEDDRKVEDRVGTLLSPYAATKKINEVYAQVYSKTFGIETVGLRYFNVFGPRQDPNGPYAAVIPRWLSALKESKQSVIYGDGTTSRDFCFVKNVVQANLLAGSVGSESGAVGSVVNVACGATTSLTDLWNLLRDAVAKKRGIDPRAIPEVIYEPFRKGDIKHSCATIDRAQLTLGYRHTHSVQEGIAELVEAEV